jgi:2-iminobutanoate/2-iminopropanoate deaminase
VNAVYAETFREPFPARSCVEVSHLPLGAPILIEAVAFVA